MVLKNLISRLFRRFAVSAVVTPLAPTPKVVFLNPKLALTEAMNSAFEVKHSVARKNDYIDFIQEKRGYRLSQMLDAAVENGYSSHRGWDDSRNWTCDPELQKLFIETLRPCGFNASFHLNVSDGPEADTMELRIEVHGYAQLASQRRRQ